MALSVRSIPPGPRRLAAALVIAVMTAAAGVLAQPRAALTPDQTAQRWKLERELQDLAVVDRKVMMPMRDGVRLATDIYRPKNATGKVPIGVRQDAVQLQFLGRAQRRARRHDARRSTAIKRGYAYVGPERARPLLLRGQLRHPRRADHRRLRDAIDWLTKQPWSNGKVGTTGCSSTAEWQMAVASLGASGVCGDERAGLRRRRRPRRPVLRAGQLVSRRRGADAVHHLALRRAEPGAADVPEGHAAGGSDSRVEVVRPRAADAAGRLGRRRCWHLPVQDIIKNVGRPARHLRRSRCRSTPAAR